MSQVIGNLIINADQAMPKGKIIRIEAEETKEPSDVAIVDLTYPV